MFSQISTARWAVYLAHGAAIWMAASLVHFPLFVAHPIAALLNPSKAIVIYALLTLLAGEMMGTAIYSALRFCDSFPGRTSLHIALPSITAAMVGAVYALFVVDPLLYPPCLAPATRPLSTRIWTGTLLALVATPSIIIRSSRLSARRGIGPPPAAPEHDPRWRV